MQKPVVCHLVERLSYGGAETLVHRFARGMRDGEYEFMVCCLQNGPLGPMLEADGIHVECLGLERRSVLDTAGFVSFGVRAVAGLVRAMRRHRVSLLHAHLPDAIVWAALAGAICRTPVVGTYHGLGILPSGRGRFDPRNRLRLALYRTAGRLSDRTTAVSAPVHDLLCRELGFPALTTVLLQNGIDTAAFRRSPRDERTRASLSLDGRRVITCVGRLVENKGQQYLIDAMPQVLSRHPDAALLLVGDGPQREALERLARHHAVEHAIRFAGDRNDVPALLALTDVFVLPSFYEGIPLALVEAMAAGAPVVATAVPGNLDVVGDEGCGVLVPPKDAPALARAIDTLLRDPDAARELAERGRSRAERHFDLRPALAGLQALYDDVLARRGRLVPRIAS